MSATTRIPFLLLALGCALAPAPAAAQAVRGELIDQETRLGISGALVVLLDQAGRPGASTLTDDGGGFLLRARRPGRYRLRADRIGYAATLSAPLALEAGTTEYRMVAATERIQLEGVVAQGVARCEVRPSDGDRTAVVWEEARKALRAVESAREQRLYRYAISRYEQWVDARTRAVTEQADRRAELLLERPFHSVPLDRLVREGYVERAGDTLVYHAPSPEVLLSDAFLDHHCFHLRAAPDGEPGRIGLAFQPVRDRRIPDVEGVLWLDRASGELRSLEFEFTRAPVRGRRGVPGGSMEFGRLPNGVTYVARWQIRMPAWGRDDPRLALVPERLRPGEERVRVEGGEVVSVTTATGAPVGQATDAALTGVVFDSTRAAPLAGARVYLSGTRHAAETDSTGRYRIRGLPPGTYTVGVAAPRLAEIGYYPPPAAVTVAAGDTGRVDLAVPPWARVLAAACGAPPGAEAGAIAGFVRDAGTGEPVPARVRVSWPGAGRGAGSVEAAVDSTGAYRLCGVPAGVPLVVAVEAEGAAARAELRLADGTPTRHDVALMRARQAAGPATGAPARRADRITHPEILASGAPDAFALVQALRPLWLQTRGTQSFREDGRLHVSGALGRTRVEAVAGDNTVVVYLDQARLGGIEALRRVGLGSVRSVEWVEPRDAVLRWGAGHDHGVILLSTRPPER